MNSSADNRLGYIRKLAATTDFVDDVGLLRALVKCLSASQAAALLLENAQSTSNLRDAAIRKVLADAKAVFLPAHQSLVRNLLNLLAVAPPATRQGVAFCLSTLLPVLPADLRDEVFSTFVASKYVGLRRRAYKAIARESEPPVELILAALRTHDDPECAWLATRFLPSRLLLEHQVRIESKLTEGWQLSRFYLRLYEADASVIDDLFKRDAISYCYVMAKVGKKISAVQARTLVERSETDERLGLLVWSLGEMGLWGVLKWLGNELPQLQERRVATLVANRGV